MSLIPSWLPFGFVRASASARAAALASAKIEELAGPDGAATLISDGRETKGALPVVSKDFDAAIYSSRGRGYARYNEDAGGLFTDGTGRMYAFALDQAGGLGGRIRGRASALAAARVFLACRAVATSAPEQASIRALSLVLDAFAAAHSELVTRSEGEVSTAVVAIASRGEALLVNSGDSGALHYDLTGRVKNRTKMHELGPPNIGCLAHALGLEPEGAAPESYRWMLDRGDWIVIATDGLLDSGLSEGELGALLAESTGAEDAVNRVCTTVLRRMATFRAKPDNLTVLAVRSVS